MGSPATADDKQIQNWLRPEQEKGERTLSLFRLTDKCLAEFASADAKKLRTFSAATCAWKKTLLGVLMRGESLYFPGELVL